MIVSRRSLIGGLATGAVLGATDANACTIAPQAYEPTEADRSEMLNLVSRFRAAYNDGDMLRAIPHPGKLSILKVFDTCGRGNQPQDMLLPLRKVREDYGRMTTPVTAANTLLWPQSARVYFVPEMEREPIDPDVIPVCPGIGFRPALDFVFSFDMHTHRPAYQKRLGLKEDDPALMQLVIGGIRV